LQVSSATLQLLVAAIQHHISVHSDGSALTATLSLLMTERALQMSLQQKHSLVVDLFDVIAEAAVSYLTSDKCPVRRPLQLDNLKDVLKLLRGFVNYYSVVCSQKCPY